MTKIYLQNLEKTKIAVFDDEDQVGAEFIGWIKLTQKEIDAYLLQQAKDNKIKELETAYASKKTWLYTLYSNNVNPAVLKGMYASLTQDTDFFAKTLPAAKNSNVIFFDDKGQVVNFFLTAEKSDFANNQINVKKNLQIRLKKENLLKIINSSTTPAEINAIKIEEELQNAVDRQINMDN